MIEENQDGDPQFYLPKGESVLTPERKRMLGFAEDEDVTYAEIEHINIMALLHKKGIIDDSEYNSGKTFRAWRAKKLSPFRGEIMPYDVVDGVVSGESDGLGEFGFTAVMQKLRAHDSAIIAKACDNDGFVVQKRLEWLSKNDKTRHMHAVHQLRNEYKDSFIRLEQIMIPICKEIATRRVANKKSK